MVLGYSHACGLDMHFPGTKDIEGLLMHLVTICVSGILCPFFKAVIASSTFWHKSPENSSHHEGSLLIILNNGFLYKLKSMCTYMMYSMFKL